MPSKAFLQVVEISLFSWHTKSSHFLSHTLNSKYNEKNMQRNVKGDVFIGEWEIFGVEVFLRYSRFFVKDDFFIDGVECMFFLTPGRRVCTMHHVIYV